MSAYVIFGVDIRDPARYQYRARNFAVRRVKPLIALCTLVFVLALATAPAPAVAQPYPTRPITLIVGFAAGGPTDVIARLFAQRMSSSLGQPILVEDVPGATGSIAAGRLVNSLADGYTILMGNSATQVTNAVFYSLKYDVKEHGADCAASKQSIRRHFQRLGPRRTI